MNLKENVQKIVEDFFAHGACPKDVNDLNISCGHFKHNLYWDIIKGKCILVTTILLPNHRVSIQVDLSFMSVTSSVRYCFFMMVLVLS